MAAPESQTSRDARIQALWKKLDPSGKGEIDVNGLRRGLKKIDHPLKHAQEMLEDVVKAMDKNGDNVIQYEGAFGIIKCQKINLCKRSLLTRMTFRIPRICRPH